MGSNAVALMPEGAEAAASRQGVFGRFSPAVWVWIITILGGALRFVRFDVLGLWIDEGFSLMFARMSWGGIFGFEGVYDSFSHPPLYYATTKLFGLVVPEVVAGRLVSVVAGTLTIPVLFVLAKRITTDRIAVVAALVLAVSPLHLWYSRDGRMYAAAMLCVALSYWALVEFYYGPGKKWAALYGLSVLLAMYYDYSAFYALAPQLVVLWMIVARWRRVAISILVGLGVAIVGYLPWIPAWLSAVSLLGGSRAGYLGLEWGKIPFYVLGVGGVAERGFYLGEDALWWENWPGLYWVFAVPAVAAMLVGGVRLAREYKFAFVVVSCMLATIVVAILSSLVSPGLGTRTIIYAVIGWSILLGAAFVGGGLPGWASVIGKVGVVAVLGFAVVSNFAIYTMADKQRWQDLSADVAAVRQFDKPVLLPRPIDYTIIDAYEPGSLDGVAITSTVGLSSDAVWFAYHDSPVFAPLHEQLKALGYERVVHKYYFNPLYLDLYAKPGVDVERLEEVVGSQ